MHTYFEFLTHIKGVEYILSVLAITGFILYLEILKPAPFQTVVRETRDELEYLRKTGSREVFRMILRICAAPFLGLAYVVMLPFVFAYALGMELLGIAAGYRPLRGDQRPLDPGGRGGRIRPGSLPAREDAGVRGPGLPGFGVRA